MDDKRIKEQMKETFNTEVPDVLSKIKSSPEFRVPPKQKVFSLKNILHRKLTLTLTSVFVVVLMVSMVIGRTNYVVASTVTLDINPSIEISLNRRDYVIGVTALNNDGEEVLDKDIKYRGLSIDEALEVIITRLNELGYVVDTTDENNVVLITVETSNDDRKTRLQEKFNERLQVELDKYNNSHWVFDSDDFNLTREQIKQVRQHELTQKFSLTKIALAYRIHELNTDYDLQDLSKLTVRQLYDLYIQLEDPNNLPRKHEMPPPRNNNQPYGNNTFNIIF